MDKFIFTKKGMSYAAKTATGSRLMFTRGKFGNGVAEDASLLEDLVKPLGELHIAKKTVDGNQVTVETQFSNVVNGSPLSEFHLKEIGLFAKVLSSILTVLRICVLKSGYSFRRSLNHSSPCLFTSLFW